MRRLTIGFTVFVLVLLFASVAGAVPPGFCDDPDHQEHPQCTTTTEPPSTTTTTTTEQPPDPCPTGTFTIEGIRRTTFECLWRPANNGADIGTVTIYNPPEGGIPRPPTLFVRDDAPGDICLYEYQWANQSGPEYVESFDLYYSEVPETDLPDVLDYSAWLGHSYWDFVRQNGMEPGTHWCAPQDYVLDGIRDDNNGGALVLTVMFDAKRGGSLDITLFPENSL